MSKLKVKNTFAENLKEAVDAAGDSLMEALVQAERSEHRLDLRQRLFWVNKGLDFYREFYNKGVNCESVSWKLLDDIVDWLYARDPDVKEELDEWYPPDSWHMKRYKKFKASEFFGDETDVMGVRDLLEAARENLEKQLIELDNNGQ